MGRGAFYGVFQFVKKAGNDGPDRELPLPNYSVTLLTKNRYVYTVDHITPVQQAVYSPYSQETPSRPSSVSVPPPGL
jgi:hypothetical protein